MHVGSLSTRALVQLTKTGAGWGGDKFWNNTWLLEQETHFRAAPGGAQGDCSPFSPRFLITTALLRLPHNSPDLAHMDHWHPDLHLYKSELCCAADMTSTRALSCTPPPQKPGYILLIPRQNKTAVRKWYSQIRRPRREYLSPVYGPPLSCCFIN